MKLHRYVDHQRLHIVTKDVISLSISVLLLFRHYISHKITFGAPSSGGVLRSACGAFISKLTFSKHSFSNAIRVSNSLDSDQEQRYVVPDLGSICVQKLPAGDIQKSPLAKKE